MRERLVGEMPAGFRRGFAREPRIAGADGDHAARQSGKTLGMTPRRRALAHQPRRAIDEAQNAPKDGEHDGAGEQNCEPDADRGFDMIALPGQDDVAGPVDDPGNAESGKGQDDKKNQNAKHYAEAGLEHDPERPRGLRSDLALRQMPSRAEVKT